MMKTLTPTLSGKVLTLWLALSQSHAAIAAIAADAAAVAAASATKTLSFPNSQPTNAVPAPPDFVSVGFETAFLDNYANAFAANLIASLAARASAPPVLRVGGTSGDRVQFDPALRGANKTCAKGRCPDGSDASFVLGPGYFDAFRSFPGARWTFQAPLGDGAFNETQLVAYVRRAWEAAGKEERVDAIALGNEPSVYWKTAREYYDGATKAQAAVVKALGLGDGKIFQIAETLNTAAVPHKPYAAQEVFKAGFDSDAKVKTVGEHWYQGTKTTFGIEALQADLMNHTAITARFPGYLKSLNAVHPTPYILSETGSTIVSGSPLTYAAGFGAALWSLDFQLAAMSRRVQRVVDSGRPAARHASFVPDSSESYGGPAVRPPWVANMFVADFVGKDKSRNVLEVSLGDDEALASAYVMYDAKSKKADRVALVNLKAWDAASNQDRKGLAFAVPVAEGTESVKVRRLRADAGVWATGFDEGGAKENVTWAGRQWTYKVDKGKGHYETGKLEEQTVKVQDGKALVNVPDTEAVIVYL
ncbi:hypothetical protein Hte_010477 [Hypoxylon texense]